MAAAARLLALLSAGILSASADVADADAAPRYTATPAAPTATAVFAVSYAGSGHTRTRYRSQPPNAGGDPDNNHVKDSSVQKWRLRFDRTVAIPACTSGGDDPCAALAGPSAATGRTRVEGRIHHVHVDGLYKEDDIAERCAVASHTGASDPQRAAVTMRYDAGRRVVRIVAKNPVPSTLELLPGACPQQGDSFDLLLDNYFTPGFSFASGWGPDRWFVSRSVAIPVAVLHASSKIRIPLHDIAANRPPRHCAVAHRYEQCTTTGSWRGTLTLKKRSR